MTTVMTREAREQFLSGLHVGVLSVVRSAADGSTLAVPIWYSYAPDDGVSVITNPESVKGLALAAAGRYSLAVQDEAIPYKYVSVEGPVTDVRPVSFDTDILPMSIRYLGPEAGARYAEHWAAATSTTDRRYTMSPTTWASADLTTFFN